MQRYGNKLKIVKEEIIADSRQHKCRYMSAQLPTIISNCADNYRQF